MNIIDNPKLLDSSSCTEFGKNTLVNNLNLGIMEEEKEEEEEEEKEIKNNILSIKKDDPIYDSEDYKLSLRPISLGAKYIKPDNENLIYDNPFNLINDLNLVRMAEYLTTKGKGNAEIVDNFMKRGIIPKGIEAKWNSKI